MAFGNDSITVAITSIASSLGNVSFPQLSYGLRHIALQIFTVDQRHELACHLGGRRTAVDLAKTSRLLVVLHKGIRLGAIVNKTLLDLFHHVIRAVHQCLSALIATSLH